MTATFKYELSSRHSMPLVGLGTSKDDPLLVQQAVVEAVRIGYRLFDTARMYKNEKHIGESIQQVIKEGLVTREELFLVTKLPPFSHKRNQVAYQLKEQLKTLQMDYVDMYLIHMPVPLKYESDQSKEKDTDLNPAKLVLDYIDHLETWQGMEDCVDLGLTKSIGLSNFNLEQVKNIMANCRIKPANLQVECHVYLQQEALIKYCRDEDIAMTAFSPLGSPGYESHMKNKFDITIKEKPRFLEHETLQIMAKKHRKTPAQVALRWLIQRGINIIPKSTNALRLQENSQVFTFHMSVDDMSQLKKMNLDLRYFTYIDWIEGIVDHPYYPFEKPSATK